MRLDRLFPLIAAALLWLAAGAAHADGSNWDALDAGTQSLLSPWRDGWNGLPANDRQRLLANASRWQAMSAGDHDALLKRQALWQNLPPAERARQRARYAAWRQLPPDDRQRVRAAAARFNALPAPQQGALRARFATQPLDWQASWLLGPAIGAWLDQAGVWFAYVPDGERDATLRMLGELGSDTRAQLFELSRRLPSPRREQLRKDLLLTPPAQRAALIAQRLAQ